MKVCYVYTRNRAVAIVYLFLTNKVFTLTEFTNDSSKKRID